MNCKILINAIDTEECRIAKVKDSKLVEFHIETAAREITHGNIYKGIVSRVEPSLQAVFVDYGGERHGFLQKNEIHSDYFQDNNSGDHSIKNIVRRGQEMIVQITKDPYMKKGAMLSTLISLPGRYTVVMPGSKTRGISRKIENEEDRTRLKSIIDKLVLPEGFGIIIRTAGTNSTKTILSKDVSYLMRLWKNIQTNVKKAKAPALLYKERNLVLRSIRDYFTSDVNEILIDDSIVYREAKDFVNIISPKHTKIVKLYKGAKPIFTKYQLEDQLASIFENRVELHSGGSIVIEQTEALVTIDVNSGKGRQKKTIEETAFMTNVEAAEEIGRQLRLRDSGGLIVIDFIDMRDKKHKIEIERVLKTHVKDDKAKINIGKITRFGLLEMSRQRLRPSIKFGGFEYCRYCNGKGLTPSPETLGVSLLRKLSLEILKEGISSAKVIVPMEVANYLLNRRRKEIFEMEARRDILITIKGDISMIPGEGNIVCE